MSNSGALPYLAPLAGRGREHLRAVRGTLGMTDLAESPLTPTLSPQAGRGRKNSRHDFAISQAARPEVCQKTAFTLLVRGRRESRMHAAPAVP